MARREVKRSEHLSPHPITSTAAFVARRGHIFFAQSVLHLSGGDQLELALPPFAIERHRILTGEHARQWVWHGATNLRAQLPCASQAVTNLSWRCRPSRSNGTGYSPEKHAWQ